MAMSTIQLDLGQESFPREAAFRLEVAMPEIPNFMVCPFCHGDGVRADGSECGECSGTGRIPVEQLPPDSSE